MSLICTNANIHTQEWLDTLIKLDEDMNQYDNNRRKFIIISLPFAMNKLQQSMEEYICDTFNDESLLFCCDIILEFMLWTKSNLNKHLKIHNKVPDPKWNNKIKHEYDQLLSTQAIIIFNIKNCDYFSIPREINTKSHPFNPIYFYYDSVYPKESELHEHIANQIANKYLPHHFIVSNDWGKRTDFTSTRLVGYLCDDGEVVQGDCLKQKGDKIFIHFNTDAPHYGKKYEWFQVPNDRICPPPRIRPKAKAYQPETPTYDWGQYRPRLFGNGRNNFGRGSRTRDMARNTGTNTNNLTSGLGGSGYIDYETVDDDLQRAIAASLQDMESNKQTQTQSQSQIEDTHKDSSVIDEEEEEEIDFFQQSVNASRLF